MPPTVHELKTDPQYFQPLLDQIKSVEIRFNDRKYQAGDVLHLREYKLTHTPNCNTYFTGREVWRRVTHVLSDPKFLQSGYVALSIAPCDPPLPAAEDPHLPRLPL